MSANSRGEPASKKRRSGQLSQQLFFPGELLEFVQTNPKKRGSAAFNRYNAYKTARTVEEALSRGATITDLKNDREKGSVHLVRSKPSDFYKFWNGSVQNTMNMSAFGDVPCSTTGAMPSPHAGVRDVAQDGLSQQQHIVMHMATGSLQVQGDHLHTALQRQLIEVHSDPTILERELIEVESDPMCTTLESTETCTAFKCGAAEPLCVVNGRPTILQSEQESTPSTILATSQPKPISVVERGNSEAISQVSHITEEPQAHDVTRCVVAELCSRKDVKADNLHVGALPTTIQATDTVVEPCKIGIPLSSTPQPENCDSSTIAEDVSGLVQLDVSEGAVEDTVLLVCRLGCTVVKQEPTSSERVKTAVRPPCPLFFPVTRPPCDKELEASQLASYETNVTEKKVREARECDLLELGDLGPLEALDPRLMESIYCIEGMLGWLECAKNRKVLFEYLKLRSRAIHWYGKNADQHFAEEHLFKMIGGLDADILQGETARIEEEMYTMPTKHDKVWIALE